MKEKSDELNLPDSQAAQKEEKTSQGYPIYPDGDDIYVNFQEEEDINPEDTSKTKEPNSNNAIRRKDLDEAHRKNDLDIPGAELDDLQEDIGSEDV
jgi:hypothetical protein